MTKVGNTGCWNCSADRQGQACLMYDKRQHVPMSRHMTAAGAQAFPCFLDCRQLDSKHPISLMCVLLNPCPSAVTAYLDFGESAACTRRVEGAEQQQHLHEHTNMQNCQTVLCCCVICCVAVRCAAAARPS
jgi:hypothetical protein